MKIAIVGASGFVGTRLVEHLVLRRAAEVVPVARSFSSLAVLSRFDLPWRVCDILDSDALAEAFRGCEVVVHAALGDPAQIVKMAESVYRGAERAGVRRLVVLSSAVVHGFAPAPGTTEDSPFQEGQGNAYGDGKAQAERLLLKLRAAGKVELVQLRPAIIYGPRRRMIAEIAHKLSNGTAYLLRGGAGICNAIYVDNLIAGILAAAEKPAADGHTFFLGDAETVTWRQLYEPIAAALGVSMETVHEVEPPVFPRPLLDKFFGMMASPPVQAVLPVFPGRLKYLTKRVLKNFQLPPPAEAWTLPRPPGPVVTEEMSGLQQCVWKLPHDKATALLGYTPPVPFQEGMARTIGWLEFIGQRLGNADRSATGPDPAE